VEIELLLPLVYIYNSVHRQMGCCVFQPTKHQRSPCLRNWKQP